MSFDLLRRFLVQMGEFRPGVLMGAQKFVELGLHRLGVAVAGPLDEQGLIAREAIITSRNFSTCTGCASTPSLSVKPGASALTVIPCAPTSRASARVNAIIAPLLDT